MSAILRGEYILTLVILAAGMGSRYGGLKQLDPFTENGEFIIDFSIFDAIKAGFNKVVFIIKRENFELFRESVGKRIEPYIKTEYAFQELDILPKGFVLPEGRIKPWGTSHALLCAEDYVDENFAVINADDFYGRDAFERLAKHLKDIENAGYTDKFCMISYILRNTLTENGTVSRGQCFVNESGDLLSIVERTKIKSDGCDAEFFNDNGQWEKISGDTPVSMNCWGLTPSVFPYLKEGFKNFLENGEGDILKKEYYLPAAVDEMMHMGLCDVKVYRTTAQWYGVTYPEDKNAVVSAIGKMINDGEYPSKLWK